MIFAHLSIPEPITGPAPTRCTRKASAILRHSADQKPVAVCENRNSAMVYLCAWCVAHLRAELWLMDQGLRSPSSIAIRTAARLLGAQDGYEPAKTPDHRADSEWFYLLCGHGSGRLSRDDCGGKFSGRTMKSRRSRRCLCLMTRAWIRSACDATGTRRNAGSFTAPSSLSASRNK